MESSRRLVAIMFTDIVGYTALMGENEEIALNLLGKNRAIHKSLIAQYRGEWIKEMGDGTLASFNTSTDAVICGAAIQNEAKKEGIVLRIGIHVDEVVFDDHDVFGDGVNISSRIESIAPPGGIWVSESVHQNVHNKNGIETTFAKEAHLKNVKEPVKIYEVTVKDIEAVSNIVNPYKSGKTHLRKVLFVITGLLVILVLGYFGGSYFTSSPKSEEQIFHKSIAVLPFKNESPNDENVYFCNGIMEGILDHLSKIPDLSVVSRTSVEQYRNNPPSTMEIAKQLGVNYILEGSVFRVGNNSKITAQLINASEDRNLWSDQFDRDLDDIFSVLAEVTQTIARELKATITPELLERIESNPTNDISAYDYYLQGKEHFNNFISSGQEADLDNAETLYNAALELDPDFGLTYAGLARIHWERNQFNFYKDETSVDTVLQLCNKAIALDSNAADAYWVRGAFYDHFLFEIEKAEKDLKKAIEVKPSHLEARLNLAFLLAFHNRDYISSLELLGEAENIDKSSGQLHRNYRVQFVIYQSIGYWEKCIEYYNKRKEVNPLTNEIDLIWLNFHQGKFHEALNIAKSSRDTISINYGLLMGKGHLLLREYAQALIYFERWENLRKENPGGATTSSVHNYHYGMALFENGRAEEGIQIMQDQLKNNEAMMKTWQRMDDLLYTSAGIYAFLGEKERAYDYLRRFDGSLIRWGSLIYLVQFDPMFDNLREDKEFKSIINEVQGEHKSIREELGRAEARREL